MNSQKVKIMLEECPALRFEAQNRKQQLKNLKIQDMEHGTNSAEEYARQIAPAMHETQRRICQIEQAVQKLPDAACREVVRLRYLESRGIRPTPWKNVAASFYGSCAESYVSAVLRCNRKALEQLSGILSDSGRIE